MGIPGASAGDPVCGMRRADVPMPGAVEAPEKQIVERLGIVWSVCSSIFHPLVEPDLCGRNRCSAAHGWERSAAG